MTCRVCGEAAGAATFTAREMMLGLGDAFEYVECAACGSLVLRDVPADLGAYYAPPYYSFGPPHRSRAWKRWLKRRIGRHRLRGGDPLGALLARLRGTPPEVRWIARAGLGIDAVVLDVGAGNGQLLLALHEYGISRLHGVDPFLPADVVHPEGIRVAAAGIGAATGPFDLVMFHHSLEHAPDPVDQLTMARQRLTPAGRVLVRVPLAAASWREYGAHWVELDAPRHLHVPTARGMERLAERAGLRVVDREYDTSAFELWGSEQYRRGIPLAAPESHGYGGRGDVFTAAEMRAFADRAAALNRSGEAGRAAFWLAPA